MDWEGKQNKFWTGFHKDLADLTRDIQKKKNLGLGGSGPGWPCQSSASVVSSQSNGGTVVS